MKKEDSNRVIADLDLLISDYNSIQAETFIGKVVPLFKKVFGSVFFMEQEYTFEELIEAIRQFKDRSAKLETGIIALQQEEAAMLDKKNNVKRDEHFVQKIKELRTHISELNQEYHMCQRIAKVLEHKDVTDHLVSFCQKLSHLQFSGVKLSHEHYTTIFFNFLWILNQFMFEFKEMPRKNGIARFLKFPKKKYDTLSFQDLMNHARESLDKDNIADATSIYNTILRQYTSLDKESQGSCYGELFILWFEIHFYHHRKSRAKSAMH
jgi:hypothetical protein